MISLASAGSCYFLLSLGLLVQLCGAVGLWDTSWTPAFAPVPSTPGSVFGRDALHAISHKPMEICIGGVARKAALIELDQDEDDRRQGAWEVTDARKKDLLFETKGLVDILDDVQYVTALDSFSVGPGEQSFLFLGLRVENGRAGWVVVFMGNTG